MTHLSDTTTKLSGQPEEAQSVDLILETPGKAIVGLVDTLRPALKSDLHSIARNVFNTPSLLIPGIPRSKALQIQSLLEETGARLRLESTGSFTPKSEGTFETALVVRELKQIPAIIQQLSLLLRIPSKEALQLLYKSPILVLGHLSKNSALALKETFKPLHVDVLISDTKDAAYDLYLSQEGAHLRNDLISTLQRRGIERAANSNSPNQPLIAAGLNHQQAMMLWEQYGTATQHIQVINRDFYTFDLRWQWITPEAKEEPVAAYIQNAFSIPPNAIELLILRKNFILAQDLSLKEMESHLNELTQLGVRCVADLTTLQSYTCVLKDLGDRQEAEQAIEAIAGLSAPTVQKTLKSPGQKLLRTTSKLQANWLRYAIRHHGGTLEILTEESS